MIPSKTKRRPFLDEEKRSTKAMIATNITLTITKNKLESSPAVVSAIPLINASNGSTSSASATCFALDDDGAVAVLAFMNASSGSSSLDTMMRLGAFDGGVAEAKDYKNHCLKISSVLID